MKPSDSLTENAKRVFNELEEHLKDEAGTMKIDYIRLSELAHAIDMVERARSKINNPPRPDQEDGVQVTKNGYTQVTGYVTVADKYSKMVDTLGAKFGITPLDREKISAFSKKKPSKEGGFNDI